MKTLMLFTNKFPYSPGEEFLESEVQYYSNFDKVIFVPVEENADNEVRTLPIQNYEVLNIYPRETYWNVMWGRLSEN